MTKGEIVPPRNLLEQVEGVERTLRRGRRLGALGWLSAIFGLAQVIVAVASAEIWNFDLSRLADQWPLWSAITFFVLAGVLQNWTRFWVRESRSPFRYTFSIAPFEPVPAEGLERGLLSWLERDLEETLSKRIPRLSRLDQPASPQVADQGDPPEGQPRPGADASHIHIAATYGVRRRKDGRMFFEVTPWVRMGPRGAPSTLAHPVRFRLRDSKGPDEDEDAYESVTERIYFSVATAIYARIEKDVEEKIDLLPSSAFRAAAYFHEAEDYVRSNTLDAYDKAGALYRAVIEIYDPEWRRAAGGSWGRSRQSVLRLRARVMRRARSWGAKVWPRVAAAQLTAARAHLGYANTLLYRRILASLSGQRINPVFETRRGTERAIGILEALPEDVMGRREVLFNAYVTLALAATQLHSGIEAKGWLREAQALDPARAERNARCLFVRGMVQPQLRPRAQLLRQAVEADPDFEVAQFELAKTIEMVWRTRPTFEPNVAKTVLEEYEQVLRLNPGNVVAWANVGYIHWLLEEFGRARDAYERGRQYKEIKRETFVAQLDYGLARVAGEGPEARFADAYLHYLNGVTADIASGVSHDPGYSDYQFELIGGPMMRRFEKYLDTVRDRAGCEDPDGLTTKRERESVLAFVLNDYGEACVNYYNRFGDPGYTQKALAAFEEASRLSPGFLLPYYNLHRFGWLADDRTGDVGTPAAIERVYEREPNWPDAMLELVREDAERVPSLRGDATRLRREAEAAELEASEKRAEASQLAAAGLKPGARDSVVLQVPQPPGPPAVARAVAEQARAAERRRGLAGPDPKKLKDEALQLEDEASSLRRQADVADGDAERREGEIAELLGRLLPQRWLWAASDPQRARSRFGPMGRLLPGGHDAESGDRSRGTVLDLAALDRPDYERELRWERELDEVHVQALLAWCITPAADREAAERVLRHILERYWAGDFGVLREYRRHLLGGEAAPTGEKANLEEVHGRLVEIIDGWLAGDPDFWKLTWLLEDPETPEEQRIFTVDEASSRLNAASVRHEERVGEALRREREAGDPDYVHLWVGDQLYGLGRRGEDVLAVYRRAARSKRPEIQEELGRRFGAHESWRESADAYRAAACDAPDDSARKRSVTGVARALFALDEHSEAIEALEALAAKIAEDGRWRTDLVDGLAEQVATPAAYAALAEWLETPLRVDRDAAGRDAASALIELAGRRFDVVVRAPEAHRAGARRELSAGATPLLLETDPAFFPDGEQTPELAPTLEAIEKARAEIEAAMGLTIPGVRIRVDPTLEGGRYVVLLREAPIATGRLDPADRGFHGPMIEHLRRTVVDHLANLTGFQDVEGRLADWEQTHVDGVPEWAEGVLGDERRRVRLVQVVQALVRERVCIRDLGPIFEAYASVDPELGLQDAVEAVRGQLQPEELGLREDGDVVAVPGDLEAAVADGVHRDNGKTFLALPTLEADELIAEFRRLVEEAPEPVLVVRNPQVRRFARRVLEREYPAVPMLARSELGGPRWRRRLRTVRP